MARGQTTSSAASGEIQDSATTCIAAFSRSHNHHSRREHDAKKRYFSQNKKPACCRDFTAPERPPSLAAQPRPSYPPVPSEHLQLAAQRGMAAGCSRAPEAVRRTCSCRAESPEREVSAKVRTPFRIKPNEPVEPRDSCRRVFDRGKLDDAGALGPAMLEEDFGMFDRSRRLEQLDQILVRRRPRELLNARES